MIVLRLRRKTEFNSITHYFIYRLFKKTCRSLIPANKKYLSELNFVESDNTIRLYIKPRFRKIKRSDHGFFKIKHQPLKRQ
jgi:hypothetical protein